MARRVTLTLSALLLLAGGASARVKPQLSSWTSCGTDLECASLSVPLEWSNTSTSTSTASIALVRYNATVPSAQRLGSLLINPGGPGASGVGFVQAGAAAISLLTGGLYDIIGFDPRGVGASSPLMTCFDTVGEEYTFSNSLPSAPNLWLGSFGNASYDAQIAAAIAGFDAEIGKLAEQCATHASAALGSSTTAYVVRDMAAIVDALDGAGAPLNYWGFSYGSIHAVEFIQTFPERVGRILVDGVVDAEANALPYVAQLPNDQVSVRDALNDFIAMCEVAGARDCPFSVAPASGAAASSTLTTRVDGIFADLFQSPIDYDGFAISLDVVNPFLWSFLRLPPTWSYLASILQGLENRNATLLVNLLVAQAGSAPSNASAAATGALNTPVLQCLDNAPADPGQPSLAELAQLTQTLSQAEDTPLLNAGLTPISFCRNFPTTRPQLPNLGARLLGATDTLLAAAHASPPLLILNPAHDPITPLVSARRLRALLPRSSVLAIRPGPGHTSVSLASLSTAQIIQRFFMAGDLPDESSATTTNSSSSSSSSYSLVDQNVFPSGAGTRLVEAAASYTATRTYTVEEKGLLDATYAVFLSFLAIA
jgi:pimeloyl-ACP methyl ester carboxylesterase